MTRILFQGDSITDTGRSRQDLTHMGFGYAALVQSSLGADKPGEFEFINRGVGGNRVTDLYARIKLDLINLKPDVLSILIGVNDVWHEVDRQDGVCAERFFNIYCALIEEVKAALPNIRIMIMEPYVMKGSATEEKWDEFKPEVTLRAEKARAVAQKYDLEFIPLQCIFDAAEKLCPVSYWLRDGVHPTNMGHELIKREWLKAYHKTK